MSRQLKCKLIMLLERSQDKA